MPTFHTKTLPLQKAPAFEAELHAAGYYEQDRATMATLQPKRYFKRTTSTDPQTFGGSNWITFEVRD